MGNTTWARVLQTVREMLGNFTVSENGHSDYCAEWDVEPMLVNSLVIL